MPIYYPPPQPYQGGRQPTEPRKLTPQSAPPVNDNPPFGLPQKAMTAILKAWEAASPLPEITVGPLPQSNVVITDPPPVGRRDWLWNAIAAWQPPRLVPLWSLVIIVDNPPVNNNPPFGLDIGMQAAIINAWNLPAPPIVTAKPGVPQPNTQPQDNPPFDINKVRTLATILAAWQPPPPLPTLPINLPQPFVFLPNDPPFGINLIPMLANVLKAWEPPPPLPQQTPQTQVVDNQPVTVIGRRKRKFWFRSGG